VAADAFFAAGAVLGLMLGAEPLLGFGPADEVMPIVAVDGLSQKKVGRVACPEHRSALIKNNASTPSTFPAPRRHRKAGAQLAHHFTTPSTLPPHSCGALCPMKRRILTFLISIAASVSALANPVDWAGFLGRQDLVWSKNPASWDDGAFIGNGDLGAIIHLQDGHLAWEINRTSLYVNRSRMQVGRLALVTAGKITAGEARLTLWDAEATGTVTTDKGSVRWRSFTATDPSVIVIELERAGGEAAATLSWIPAVPRPPRKVFRKDAMLPGDEHPPAQIETTTDGFNSVQTYLENGAATVVLRRQIRDGHEISHVSIGRGDSPKAAMSEADAALAKARLLGPAALMNAHRAWWHRYYPASFVSIPDARLESYYWIQIYKLGAAMRADGPILDLLGPWFKETPWPAIWWNLNTQLTYSPLATANRLPQAESLWRPLDANHEALRQNVRPEFHDRAMALGRVTDPGLSAPVDLTPSNDTKGNDGKLEAGNLTWQLFYYWQASRYLADDAMLRERVLPLLKPAVGFYLVHLKNGSDGKLHLPPTHSPELATLADASYDRMILEWGLRTLIASAERLKLNDPELPLWRETLSNLAPLAVDDTGFMIGPGRPLRESHRHFSHLIGVYPLRVVTLDDPANRELVTKSINHWIALLKQGGGLTGYTHTGAAAMWALLGDGDRALQRLYTMLNNFGTPNTLYRENGPVIETPLSVATSLQDMLLQSYGGKLHVFPAVPTAWKDTTFANLRGEGAFLVSAVRREGRTAWVRIESLEGEPCSVAVRDWETTMVLASSLPRPPAVVPAADGIITLVLPKGAWIELGERADDARLEPAPVERAKSDANPYPQRSGR
jgi:alpha-L-fucosidase 2